MVRNFLDTVPFCAQRVPGPMRSHVRIARQISALEFGIELGGDLVPVHPGPFHGATGGSGVSLKFQVGVDEETLFLIVESGAWRPGISEVPAG